MKDFQIRQSFHKKKLKRHHADDKTLVIDELGLNHGKCRADIAVVNGHLEGYEIKSDSDSLYRLERQVQSYNAVFDRAFVITGERYAESIDKYIPEWWGVIVSTKGSRGSVNFKTFRRAKNNNNIDLLSVAQLLWRNEAVKILSEKELSPQILRKPRSVLYQHLVDILQDEELKRIVREYLKKRKNWRHLSPLLPNDDSCQPAATL